MKKIYFISILLSVLFLQACNTEYKEIEYSQNQNYYTVKTWSISTQWNFIWNIESQNQTVLSSKTFGRVNTLNFSKWDFVNKWQIIASVDSVQSSISYDSIWNVLENLRSTRNSTELMFQNQIKSAQSAYHQAQNSINMIKSQLAWTTNQVLNIENINKSNLQVAQEQINSAQLAIESINNEIENAKTNFEQQENNIYSNATSSISASSILSKNILKFTDEILWVSNQNKNKNNSFETYLSARNSSLKAEAKNTWSDLNNKFEQIENMYNNLETLAWNPNWKEKIQEILSEYEKYLSDLRSFLSEFYEVLDKSVNAVSFPESKINNLKERTINYQQNLEKTLIDAQWNFMVWIKWSLQAIKNLENEKTSTFDRLKNNLEQAQKQLDQANKAYENYEAMWTSESTKVLTQKEVYQDQIKVYEQQSQQAQDNVSAIQNQMESELSSIDSKIAELEWQRKSVSSQIQNTNIVAPFSWVIIENNVELGQLLWPENPAIIFASNQDLKINIKIPQTLWENISQWDNVNIKISWKEQEFTWFVSKIFPNIDPLSKRLDIEIKFNESPWDTLIWMFANISFDKNNISWLKVPYSYIKYDYWSAYLNILQENKSLQKIDIEKIQCNNWECIIKWDLSVWDKIIR